MGFTNGPANLMAIGTTFDNMDELIKGNEAVSQADRFGPWTAEAVDYLDLTSAEWSTYNVLRSGGGISTNFTQTVAVNVTPGQLEPARESLNTLAMHYESVYSRPVDILCLEAGLHYRHFIQIGYDNMAQYDADQAATASDEVYGKWANDMADKFDRASIEKMIGRWY
ncbi:MAG: hypothetical protein AB8G95_19220, partial [Anaerolineae bacterium]